MARASFVRMLKHTCTVQVASSSSTDVHGQPVLSWANEDTAVKCLWQESLLRGQGGLRGDPWTERLDFDGVLFIVYDIDVDETRRITNIQDSAGNVLEAGSLRVVKSVNAGGQQHHLQLYCKRSTVLEVS